MAITKKAAAAKAAKEAQQGAPAPEEAKIDQTNIFGKPLHVAIGETTYYKSQKGPVETPFESLSVDDQETWTKPAKAMLVAVDSLGRGVYPIRNLEEERLANVMAVELSIKGFIAGMTSGKDHWAKLPVLELAAWIVDGRNK